MAVFDSCSVLFELKNLPFKEKNKLKSAVTDNGGSICFVVNKQCSLIVTSDVSCLSANRLRSIQKYQTPVVGVDYVFSCVERGALLPVDEYKLDAASSSAPLPLSRLRPEPRSHHASMAQAREVAAEPSRGPAKPVASVSLTQRPNTVKSSTNILDKFRIYTETDSDLPLYPDNFQVAKYSIYKKVNSNTWCVLELQSFKGKEGWRYRVVRYMKDDIGCKKAAAKDMLVFLSTSEEALEVYKALRETLQATGLQLTSSIPPQAQDLGSAPLQQLLLEEKLNTGSLSQEVAVFVELLWTEALGCLSNILRVPADKLSLNDVSRAEGLLLQSLKKLKEASHMEAASLLCEVNTLLPIRELLPPHTKVISQYLDVCQLIRDVLNVSEMTLRSPVPSSLGKYRALRCSIEAVPPSSPEFHSVTALLQDSKLQVQQVLRLSRGVEQQTFKSDLGNIKPLLHSTNPSNIVGVLSRGLLLPRVGVERHGIERTDAGNLGSGIYFSDAASTSIKYSKPSQTDGSRLLLVCDVALGQCMDVHKRDLTLTHAPEGHHSVHGVRGSPNMPSEFEDDEFVVYSPDQVKLKYVVQFSIEGDHPKEFSPAIVTAAEPCPPPSDQELVVEDSSFENIKNPLEDVTAGLLDSSGQQLPLQAVHIKCKLVDLLSQVIIFQKYTNQSSVPIEAKYVFPLEDSAAVCGFEAFIDGKHVVGQVKEKETARKEYKQAIEKGHGAYLMDQDAPDVFTISVGNLPPGATVLIKVTFVSELIVRDGSILFSLPGSVAPWQESAALNQTTQVSVEKVCVTDEAASTREFTLDVSVEMPHEIKMLTCVTHKVKMKRTDCKAVVSVMPDEVLGPDGFQLSITLSEVHLPRMWVEKHPDKDSQACMLVFYPNFDINPSSAADEVVLLLDTSESMKGESLRMAQTIALQVLRSLNHQVRLNVIFFGTDHTEAFLTAQPLVEARQVAQRFITHSSPVGGCTELWRPLRALSLLPPSCGVRNLLLLSDGHIQNAELTLQLLRDNVQHSRLFTCGLSPTANRHMLRALAQAGGGAFEFFDTKTKHNWAEKVACQVRRMASPGCSSVSVKWQQFNPTAPPPVQAPKQLHALFNNYHTLVYGFVPHCTQATLLGNLSGQELQTMVSTSDLQKTRGTFLHKLTARALIRDYEDGTLGASEAEHEGKKVELKHFIIELSKEFSILSQFTSFVAIEERDSEQTKGSTDIPGLVAEEDVDFLPYVKWMSPEHPGAEEFLKGHDFDDEEFECESYSEDSDPDLDFMEYSCVLSSGEEQPGGGVEEREELDYCIQSALITSPPSCPDIVYGSASLEALVSFPVLPRPPPPFPLCGSTPSFHGPPPALPFSSLHRAASSPHHLSQSASVNTSVPNLNTLTFPVAPPPPAFSVIRGLSLPAPSPSPPGSSFHFGRAASTPAPPPPPPPTGPSFLCGVASPWSAPPPPPPPPPAPRSSVPFGAARSSPAPPPPPPASFVRSAETSSFHVPPPPPSVLHGTSSPPAQAQHPTSRIYREGRRLKRRIALRLFSKSVEEPSVPVDVIQSIHSDSRSELVASSNEKSVDNDLPSFFHTKEYALSLSPDDKVEESTSLHPGVSTSISLDQSSPYQEQAQQHSGVAFGYRRSCRALSSIPSAVEFQKKKSVKSKSTKAAQAQSEPAAHMHLYKSARSVGMSLIEEGVHLSSSSLVHRRIQSPDPEALKLRWTKIFQIQHSDGYWELTTELGKLINVDVDLFANVFLKSKGIQSLGVRAHTDILRLVATLLVLQLMRVEKLEEGKLLRTLFCLDASSQLRPERCEEVKRAVDWVCWADRQYPCVYSRLEFGLSWESSTRQLLGYEGFPPFSPLSGLNLQRTSAPLSVH